MDADERGNVQQTLKDRRVLLVSNYLPYSIKARKENPFPAGVHSGGIPFPWIDILFDVPDNRQHNTMPASPLMGAGPKIVELRAPKTLDGFTLLDGENVSMAIPIPSASRRGSAERVARSLEAISDESSGSLPLHPPDCFSPIYSTAGHEKKFPNFYDDNNHDQEALSSSLDSLREEPIPGVSSVPGLSDSLAQLSLASASPIAHEWVIEPFFGGNIGLKNAINAGEELFAERIWIGGLATDASTETIARLTPRLKDDYDCVVVNLADRAKEGHYNRFCKKIMWPIFHNMLPEHQLISLEEDWEAFVQVNRSFAKTIIEAYKSGDLIWINDYHLMLVPLFVREALPEASIGFFLHVPFPTSEIFRCLSVRQEILRGVLGADLIGFQTYGYARHFLQCCTRILGFECNPRGVNTPNRIVAIGIFPIGVDSRMIERRLGSPAVSEIALRLRERNSNVKIIIGRDKMDPVKGIKQKLLGFEQFLSDHPEWRERVVLMQVALAASAGDRHHQSVSDIVARINSRFGSIGYTPVLILSQIFTFEQYLALLSIADVCLITSLRDGMNLTSHEYILSQHGNAGSLIISEFAGTSSTFEAAIRVNPWDVINVSEAIAEALEMDEEERFERHTSLYKHVVSNTALVWTRSFLCELIVQSEQESQRQKQHAPLLNGESFMNNIGISLQAKVPVCIILDYDAMVPPFKEINKLVETLKIFTQTLTSLIQAGIKVVLISERSAEQLDHTFQDISELILCAEEGFAIRLNGVWMAQMNDPDPIWWGRVEEILEFYHERTPGSWIERKNASLIWHYGRADARFGSRQAKECQAHVQDSFGSNIPVHAITGWQRLEIKLRTVGKRQALIAIIKLLSNQYLNQRSTNNFLGSDGEHNGLPIFAFFLSAQKTEEDIFLLVRDQMTKELLGPLSSVPSPLQLGPSTAVVANGNHVNPSLTTSAQSTAETTASRGNPSDLNCIIEICSIGKENSSKADYYCFSSKALISLLSELCLK